MGFGFIDKIIELVVNFRYGKRITVGILVLIGLVAIPLTVVVVQYQQELKQKTQAQEANEAYDICVANCYEPSNVDKNIPACVESCKTLLPTPQAPLPTSGVISTPVPTNTPAPPTLTPAPTQNTQESCTPQWKCAGNGNYYQYADCSTTEVTSCNYGCNPSTGQCKSAPTPTLTPTKTPTPTPFSCTPGWKCTNNANANYYQYADCTTTDVTSCTYGCNSNTGQCESAPSATPTLTPTPTPKFGIYQTPSTTTITPTAKTNNATINVRFVSEPKDRLPANQKVTVTSKKANYLYSLSSIVTTRTIPPADDLEFTVDKIGTFGYTISHSVCNNCTSHPKFTAGDKFHTPLKGGDVLDVVIKYTEIKISPTSTLSLTPTDVPSATSSAKNSQFVGSCKELIYRYNKAKDTKCGDSLYDPVVDLNKDKNVNLIDFAIFGSETSGNDVERCSEYINDTSDACSASFTPPPTRIPPPTPTPIPFFKSGVYPSKGSIGTIFTFDASTNISPDLELIITGPGGTIKSIIYDDLFRKGRKNIGNFTYVFFSDGKPKGKYSVAFMAGNKELAVNSFEIGDPEAAKAACVPFIQNGDQSKKIDIVVISNAFNNSDEMKTFKEVVVPRHINYIFAQDPFSLNKDKFNVWYVDSDHGDIGCEVGLGTTCLSEAEKILSQTCSFVDKPIIINKNTSGGYAAGKFTITGDNGGRRGRRYNGEEATIHEFGHVMGLADEYEYVGSSTKRNMAQPNCDVYACPKWCSGKSILEEPLCNEIKTKDACERKVYNGLKCIWHDKGVNDVCIYPSDGNYLNFGESCQEDVGCYYGCSETNGYRPSYNSFMYSGASQEGWDFFNEPSKRAIQKEIDAWIEKLK